MSDRLKDLAIELADEAARSDIECMCLGVREDGGPVETAEHFRSCWYDTENLPDADDRACIDRALEYLTLRGLFRRHKQVPARIRLLDDPSISRKA